jgi:NADH-dependent peroxiredoxin subunit C
MMEDYGLPQQIKIDTEAPTWELPYYDPKTDTDSKMSSDDLNGKWHVVFFYPADFTFVCPTELKDMADASAKFEELGVEILAASTDTVFSHRAWARTEKLMENFKYKMLSDHGLLLSELYNILDEQSGIAGRGTFVIDPDGVCRSIEVASGPLGRNSDELIRKLEALKFMRENPAVACPAKWAPGARTLTPNIKIAGEVFEALQD